MIHPIWLLLVIAAGFTFDTMVVYYYQKKEHIDGDHRVTGFTLRFNLVWLLLVIAAGFTFDMMAVYYYQKKEHIDEDRVTGFTLRFAQDTRDSSTWEDFAVTDIDTDGGLLFLVHSIGLSSQPRRWSRSLQDQVSDGCCIRAEGICLIDAS